MLMELGLRLRQESENSCRTFLRTSSSLTRSGVLYPKYMSLDKSHSARSIQHLRNPLAKNLDPLVSVRSILLSDVSDRLREIERQIAAIPKPDPNQMIRNLRQQLDELLAELDRLQQFARETDNRSRDLNTEIEILRRRRRPI